MALAMKVISQVAQQRKTLEEAVTTALELAAGKSDGAEVSVSKTTGIGVSTRYGEVENVEFNSDGALGITVYHQNRKGSASSTDLSPDAIARTVQAALDIAKQNVELNKLDLNKAEFVRDDVFQLLRNYRTQGEKFDLIIMDPPKFVENKNQLASACRGYKDINMLALQLLNPGGILLSFSCSGLMPTDLFQKILADAAVDAGRDVQFIEQFRQAADHPVIATYPEGLYLKGFACRVM